MKSRRLQSPLLDQNSEQILASLLADLPEEEVFDAAALVAADSHLRTHPSLIVDLAYEDYWRRIQSGQEIDVERFAAQFPTVQNRLLHMIEVGDLIHQSPDLFLSLLQPAWPEAPCRLGCYEVLTQIGAGSFSRVFHAIDHSFNGRHVTLKISRPLTREVEALSQLNHPGIICPLTRNDELVPGLEVLVMPFHGKATLADLIRARCHEEGKPQTFDFRAFLQKENSDFLPDNSYGFQAPQSSFVSTAIWIGAQLAEALAHAHARNCYHCDIKPANVLLRPDGCPILLDFNLSVTSEEQVFSGGTLTYIAPEQLRSLGTSSALGGAADVYSLGATLVELLQGESPFPVNEDGSIDRWQQARQLADGGERFLFTPSARKRIGDQLANLLERCVDRDPQLRPTSAALALRMNRLLKSLNSRKKKSLNRIAAIWGIAVISAVTGWMTLSPKLSPEEKYQAGLIALRGHSPRLAARHFAEVISAEPSYGDAKFLLACSKIQLQEWSDAAVYLRELIKERRNPELHSLLGYVLCRMERQIEIAELEFAEALKGGLQRCDVLNNLAYCQVRLDKMSAAAKTFAAARKLGFHSPTLLLNEAHAEGKACRQGKYAPNVSIADALLKHPELANSRDGLLAATLIYWTLSKTNPKYRGVAIDVLHRGIAAGITWQDLQTLPPETWPAIQETARPLFSTTTTKSEVGSESVDRLIAPLITESAELLRFLGRNSFNLADPVLPSAD